jgi:hypothetical protein
MNFELLSILIDYVNQKKGGECVKKPHHYAYTVQIPAHSGLK